MGKFGGFGGGFGGGNNMQALMKQAQKMQEEALKAQEEVSNAEFEGTSGGGMVSAVITGDKKVVSIKIKPEACDPDDVEMLEDMIIASLNDAFTKAEEYSSSKMGKFGGLI